MHSATLLPDGRVLVVGGGTERGMTASAEIWDPATASFSPAGSLAERSVNHTATLLPDGRVLIVGGERASAEVWDPVTASFGPAGSFGYTHDGYSVSGNTITPVPDGEFLIVGGGYVTDKNSADEGYEVAATAAVWDPETASFDAAGSLADARTNHTATLLPDGHVLIVGGSPDWIASAEVWDPETASFSPAGSLATGRWNHTATPLPDGRVLIVGGSGMSRDSLPASAEVWSP